MSAQGHSALLKLVRDQQAPPFDGYNPIAPRSHRWMMDHQEDEETRGFGWVLWRTIDRDPDGKTGPSKMARTWFAHDSRVGVGKHLTDKHLAEDLAIAHSNAIQLVDRLVEKGIVRRDEKGRLSPRGDAPLPRRIKNEEQGEDDNGKSPIFICTDKSPEAIRLRFQQLSSKRRAQYTENYRKMPEGVAKHLETLDDYDRGWHTWHILEAVEYKEQLEADSIAAARSQGRDWVNTKYADAGYINDETRGRKEVDRPLLVEVTIRVRPEEYSVQINNGHSVQNGNSILHKSENGTVQKTHPYKVFQSTQSSQSEVEIDSVENTVLETSTPPPAPLKTVSKEGENLEHDPLADPDLIIDSVQHHFRRRLAAHDRLRTDFPQLANRFDIPPATVWRWIGEKTSKKASERYRIFNPGALYAFALKDLPEWIRTHGREIAADQNWEVSQAEQIRAMAVTKGLR